MPLTRETGASCDWQQQQHDETAAGTILLVEDETFVRSVTCEILESAGYRVLAAQEANEAQCLYDAHCGEVDLLFTDVVLPGRTGPELAAALRQKDPSLKVLLATGYPEQLRSRVEGQDECLAKPFSSSTLLERIQKLLSVGVLERGRERRFMPAYDVELPALCEQEYLTEAVCG